jgi:glycosyltransferase involved in cell wall biosynthesis
VVSTRVGGIADIVIEGETALLADVNDTQSYCDHLLRLVEDDELRMRMGNNSSKHVLQKFSYQRLMNDMSRLYYQLLEKKKR